MVSFWPTGHCGKDPNTLDLVSLPAAVTTMTVTGLASVITD